MRIALVVHGFPPYERTGVENYTAGIARALAQRGHVVEVFAPRVDELSPEHAIRREEVDGYGVTWVTLNHTPDGPREMLDRPGVARSFGQFLDSERPDVVHLQHVVKLGVGPIFEASKRGIPMVYTAHDYYAACHRYTLLRPDLSHCDVRGDFMACGLCDAALGYLNEIEGLGDYQMGVLPDQLTEEQRAGLAGLLDDDPEAAGWEQGALDSATDLRRELDSLRLQAFSRLDLVLAPTKYLAAELVRGGISPERVEVLPYGVETQDLQGLTPVLSEGEGGQGELRFAFFGGFSKHKGVHLLLDAFGLLGPEAGASLSLWGYGSDAPYVAQLRARAKEVGAKWGGSYAREELPAILASADVVVVPSTWVENQPLVIREAFAARRPVLASDFGAIPESVHDEVDGLLFTVGDAEDLAAKMRRCLVEPGLVARLAAAIEPVHDAADQALELEPLYTRLVEAAAEEKVAADEKAMSSTVLASVQGFGARVQEVQALSTRELYKQTMEGLADLRRELGAEDGVFEKRVAEMFNGEPRSRELLRDARREALWRRNDSEKERAWLTGLLDQKDQEIESVQAELVALREESKWLRGEVESRDEHLSWLQSKHDHLARDLAQLEELESSIRGEVVDAAQLDQFEERFDRLRSSIAAVGGQAAPGAAIAGHLLDAQALFVSAELAPLSRELHALMGEPLPTEVEDPANALLSRVRRASRLAEKLLNELTWRRSSMDGIYNKAGRGALKYLLGVTAFGREVRCWSPQSHASNETVDLDEAKRKGEES